MGQDSSRRHVWFVFAVASLMCPTAVAQQQMSPAEKFAWNLQHTFKSQGYDIDVVALKGDRILRLTSDLFKDAATREDQAWDLWKSRKALCGFDIWYVEVGYSKGMFSSDVTKRMSLGCPAAKAARIQETKAEREKYARSLDTAEIHSSVSGTTLVFESGAFADPKNRSAFVQMMLGDPAVVQNLCQREFSRLQLNNKKQIVKTAPVVCK